MTDASLSRHALRALVASAAIACAGGQGVARQTQGTIVDDRGAVTHTVSAVYAVVDTIAVARGPAMRAATDAYIALGLTPNTVDPARGIVGVKNVIVSRSLQGVPLTSYVDCGSDLTGPIAANNRVELTLLTEIQESGGRSTLHTLLGARALRTSSGASLDPTQCSTRGALERKLNGAARERVP